MRDVQRTNSGPHKIARWLYLRGWWPQCRAARNEMSIHYFCVLHRWHPGDHDIFGHRGSS